MKTITEYLVNNHVSKQQDELPPITNVDTAHKRSEINFNENWVYAHYTPYMSMREELIIFYPHTKIPEDGETYVLCIIDAMNGEIYINQTVYLSNGDFSKNVKRNDMQALKTVHQYIMDNKLYDKDPQKLREYYDFMEKQINR